MSRDTKMSLRGINSVGVALEIVDAFNETHGLAINMI